MKDTANNKASRLWISVVLIALLAFGALLVSCTKTDDTDTENTTEATTKGTVEATTAVTTAATTSGDKPQSPAPNTKTVPTLTLNAPTKTRTSVGFGVDFVDPDGVGEISKIELIHEGGTVEAENINIREFTGLFSDNIYTVKVSYTYDLGDGQGTRTESRMLEIKTEANKAPTLVVSKDAISISSVAFDIYYTDTDGVGEITGIELVHRGGTVSAESLSVRRFDGLLSNNSYTVKVTHTYDLNDGKGVQTASETLDVKTVARIIPTVEIKNPIKTQTSIGFEIDERDPHDVCTISKIELIHEGGTVVAENTDVREFTDLLPDNNYVLKVTCTYDLMDGQGTHIEIRTLDIRTDSASV